MQGIELRLIYFPDTCKWRVYSGQNYYEVKFDLSDLTDKIVSSLDDIGKELSKLADDVRSANRIPFPVVVRS